MYNYYPMGYVGADVRRPYGYGGFGSIFFPLLFLSLINRPPYYGYPYGGYPYGYGPYPYY